MAKANARFLVRGLRSATDSWADSSWLRVSSTALTLATLEAHAVVRCRTSLPRAPSLRKEPDQPWSLEDSLAAQRKTPWAIVEVACSARRLKTACFAA